MALLYIFTVMTTAGHATRQPIGMLEYGLVNWRLMLTASMVRSDLRGV